jgi:hypothetical protein
VISPMRREEIIGALRRGTVPQRGLDALAVGTDRFADALDRELSTVSVGGSVFKAIRGEYGSGKTFTVRWLAERARQQGFVTAEVQISEGETPLHHLQTVYRRACERLATTDEPTGALRSLIDGWFFALENDVLAEGRVHEHDADGLVRATDELAATRLAEVAKRAPMFPLVLRGYRHALAGGDTDTAEGLLAWLGGQPHVAASVKRHAGIKGDLDHDGALAFLAGLLVVLRDAGNAGLLLVLDEVETLQRMRSDARDRALNALRQLIDEIDAGRFPGLYLLITGTPAFFDGPQGASRLPPLAQRLHTDFSGDGRFDNTRAVQLRLHGFTIESLCEVGGRVRDLYVEGAVAPERVAARCGDDVIRSLALAVTGDLGGKVGVAPRVFLKKLVGDLLDRIDQYEDFDPRVDYAPTIADGELSEIERNARRGVTSVDDIELEDG